MISGYSHRLASGLLLAALALLGAGCSDLESKRYPIDLRYQARQDLLIKTPPAQQLRTLPPPGRLDESIAKASESKTVTKFDPKDVAKGDRDEIRQALLDVFGTPARPSVEPIDPEDLTDRQKEKLGEKELDRLAENRKVYAGYLSTALQSADAKPDDIAALKVERLALREGSKQYRRHCMHCHGLNGDGRGPTGPWVNPHPRDYRQGRFKFISTNLAASNRKPRRDDLYRTIAKGIEGTSMPAFGVYAENEIDEMVGYVIHLSIRGQVEYDTIEMLVTNKKASGESDKEVLEGGSIKTHVYYRAAVLLAAWVDSTKRPAIAPPAYPYEATDPKTEEGKAQMETAVRNGYQLFLRADKGGCISCHTDYGRQVPYNYDDWGTLVQPRNLTAATYRGGRRPLDLYWRIAGGIEPSGMKATANLSPQESWDLVHFVQALPYPKMLPEDIRKKIYVESEKAASSHASR